MIEVKQVATGIAHARTDVASMQSAARRAKMRHIGTMVERLFTVAVLCGLSGSLERLRYSDLSPEIMTGASWFLLGSSLLLLLVRAESSRTVIRRLWPNLVIVAAVFASMTWSVRPNLTSQYLLPFLAATSFAVYVGARWSLPDLLDLLLATFVFIVAATLVNEGIESVTGRGGIHQLEVNGWFTSRNHLGRCMGLALLTAAAAAYVPGRRWAALGTAILSAGMLIAADSRAATLVTPACLLGFFGMCLVQRSPRWAVPLSAAAIAGGLLVAFGVARYAEVVFGWMGRDATLTKRTVLWGLLIDHWAQRPWLGYGYGAYWRGGEGPSGEIARQLGYYPWHAHNGFLQLGLDLGILGILLFVPVLAYDLRRALRVGLESGVRWQLWPAAYLGYFVLSNLAEAELVRHDSIYWVLYLVAVAHVGDRRDTAA